MDILKVRRNKIFYGLIIYFLVSISSSYAQYTPARFFDLKSVTDSLENDHIFFRLEEKHENEEHFRNNVFKIDTETFNETLFLEDYFDSRLGFEARVQITDYIFFNNNPEKYLYIEQFCEFECYGSVKRGESDEDLFGGLFFFVEYLSSDQDDSGKVFISVGDGFIIGENGGRDWPSETFEELPDSSFNDFPLTSLNPYDNQIMFGIKFDFGSSDNGLVRSNNGGNKSDILSDTLFAESFAYDADSNTVYFIDTINAPGGGLNCSVDECKYGLYSSIDFKNNFSWNLLAIYDERVEVHTHPTLTKSLFIVGRNNIQKSEDGGSNFESIVSDETITGFTVTKKSVYYSNGEEIFQSTENGFISIKTLPVNSEFNEFYNLKHKLLSNYPNPFNPSTSITYEVPTNAFVSLSVYSINGQLIKSLVNGYKQRGKYKISFNGNSLSSGVYFITGTIGDRKMNHKLTLIK